MPPCYHSWELNREASFFDMVIEVWQNALGMDSTEQVTLAQKQLRSIEHPPSTSNTHPKQVNGFRSVASSCFLHLFLCRVRTALRCQWWALRWRRCSGWPRVIGLSSDPGGCVELLGEARLLVVKLSQSSEGLSIGWCSCNPFSLTAMSRWPLVCFLFSSV